MMSAEKLMEKMRASLGAASPGSRSIPEKHSQPLGSAAGHLEAGETACGTLSKCKTKEL